VKPASAASSIPAWRWFFPLAAMHAALLVPLSLLSLYHPGGVALLASPAAHGRELMFGFALAVIAGHLLGPLSRRWFFVLVGIWLVARLGGLLRGSALAWSLAWGLAAWRLLHWSRRMAPRARGLDPGQLPREGYRRAGP